MVGKYLANLHLNKTICAYIINNYCSEALTNSVLDAFGSKRVLLLHQAFTCAIECVVVSMFVFTVNELKATTLRCVEGESKIKVGNRYDPYASYHRIHCW